MEQINFNNLSADQRAALMAEAALQLRAEAKKKETDRNVYKELVSDLVTAVFPRLLDVSKNLSTLKSDIYKKFESVKELKSDLYGVKNEQNSDTYTTLDGKYRLKLGYNMIDNYDDTANEGIKMVSEYLDALSTNPDAAQAVKICRSLLAKDKNGTLKSSRIITLRKHALESGNAKFLEGVDIIQAAYKPERSKQYIYAQYKNARNEWVNVPLGVTEAE